MTQRVYVAGSLELLADWFEDGEIPAGGERFLPPDESEEGEYAALEAAAEASAAIVGRAGRRVVVVAQTADADAVLRLRDVAAVHADAEPPDHRDELGWYATQEIADLIG